MADGDWIRLYRKTLDWEWFNDQNTFRLWIYILLKANWKAARFQGIDVPAGAFVTSIKRLADGVGVSKATVYKCLKKLQSTGEIETKSYPRFTLILVRSWASYQTESKRSANDTYTEVRTEGSHNRRKEESKKERKKEKEIKAPALSSEEDKEWEASFGYEPGD